MEPHEDRIGPQASWEAAAKGERGVIGGGGGGVPALRAGRGALFLAENCHSKCSESRTHTQLFLPHTLTRSGGGGRLRPPISDVSNPDHAPDCQLPAADGRAERRRRGPGGRLGIRQCCSRANDAPAPPPRRFGAARHPGTCERPTQGSPGSSSPSEAQNHPQIAGLCF